ncbi:sulfite exporter TauE/SafE family protein [Aliterella atlantica]|uniref:sulfite exporter TauE/SafE family protein n=1 Tax=Aliterella atlantica TaxID=1827278 RepID=UPI000697BBF7|nr:sulfite exporter TauE/SafE family protein [Aliterella atlantica]
MLLDLELTLQASLLLGCGGFFVGCLAGLSGIGGGLFLVPMMIGVGLSPIQAVGTSNFAKLMISTSGSWQRWRTGNLDLQKVAVLGLPALLSAQIGAYLADKLPIYLLLSAFALLISLNVYFISWRRKIEQRELTVASAQPSILGRSLAGSAAGLLAGLFGVGGGIVLIPLQILMLGETVESAISTSLGVVFLSSMSACISHGLSGNVLFLEGSLLGITGAFGTVLGTRWLQLIQVQTNLLGSKRQ